VQESPHTRSEVTSEAVPGAYGRLLPFLAHPVLRERPRRRLTAWTWFGWLSLLLVLGFLGGRLDDLLVHWFGWRIAPDTFQAYLVTHPSLAAAAIVLVAPLLEELAYRAFLSTAPPAVFIGLAFFLCYTFLGIRINLEHPRAISTIRHYFAPFWALVPASLVSLALYVYARDVVLGFFRRHGIWVFWVSCVLFGVEHAEVYSSTLTWWALVLVLPQFLVGVGLAYIRIAFGLRWSIATHLAYDGLIVSASWTYLSTASGTPLREAIGLVLMLLVVLILVYGFTVTWRVLRNR